MVSTVTREPTAGTVLKRLEGGLGNFVTFERRAGVAAEFFGTIPPSDDYAYLTNRQDDGFTLITCRSREQAGSQQRFAFQISVKKLGSVSPDGRIRYDTIPALRADDI